ncbi:MAG: response regulator [Muribaculaceae bacterium]
MDPDINPSDFTILIVDDNETNVKLLQAILTRGHYNILKAYNGEDAIAMMQQHHPDLVLLDIMMPVMDGYETAKRIAEIESIRNIPYMFVTALSDTNSMVKGFKHGCNDFISKPFNTEEILIRIRHQLISVANKRIITNQTEELKRLVMNRDKLYGVVAHDLRSPLGTIKMVLNILDENLNSEIIGDELYELLHTTTESADELFALLENLLSWSKSQMGKLIFSPVEIGITDIVNEAIRSATSMLNIHNIKVNYTDLTNQITINADKNMLTTVVRNIIVNAVKFSDEGSNIDITTLLVDNNVQCSITDYGCGMNEEVQKALREHISITTTGVHQEEGTGLGLSLCREFIRTHKGTFGFTSKENVGSTFTFTVPITANA